MSVVLSIGIALALLLALLSVPITVVFRIDRTEEVDGHVNVRWLFGWVRFRIAIPGTVNRRSQGKRRRTTRTSEHKAMGGKRSVFALLRQPAFRRRAIQFVRDVLHATHPRGLYLRLRIGTGDPADTGRLWALVGPAAGIAANLRSAQIRIEPDFVDTVLELESHGAFRLIPVQFIALTVAFVISPATLRAWRTLRHSNAS